MSFHNVRSPLIAVAVCVASIVATLSLMTRDSTPKAVPFAANGGMKMLYDNRQYPQAVAWKDQLHLVWREEKGTPFVASYDLNSRRFTDPVDLLSGYKSELDPKRVLNDHHYAPVIWTDNEGHLHVLYGCHRTPGVHLISKRPGDSSEWRRGLDIAESISYPKMHRIYDGKTLMYSRYSGHLGFWQYHISNDGGHTWENGRELINLTRAPQDGAHAAYAGSYNTTAVSADGKRLHVAFIWKVEDPVFNTRYQAYLNDHAQRYNLYYLYVDLPSGEAFNIDGEPLELPLRKSTADKQCLVWDTEERVAAVGPSICLDAEDQPHFTLPISEESSLQSRFYFVSRDGDSWMKSPIVETLHPFNASHLERESDGTFHVHLIAGSGEPVVEEGMDEYGFGHRVERWTSEDEGRTWAKTRDITPVPGHRYQNVKFASDNLEGPLDDVLIFYGWKDANSPGTAYVWDGR